MKTLLAFLAFFCALVAALQIYTLPTEPLWPASMVAREIWPWFVAVNAVGLALAVLIWRPMTIVFAVGLVMSLWPLTHVRGLTRDMQHQWSERGLSTTALNPPGIADIFRNAFGGYPGGDVAPEVLQPLNVHLYRISRETGSTLRPVLINIHGGSWQHGSAREDVTFTSYFARKGWVVFSLEYRLAPQWKYPAQIDDVRAAIDWVYTHAREYGGDPERIALAGRSAGGHLAMLAAYTNDRIPIRAVVAYYAPIDLAGAYAKPPVPDPLRIRERLEIFLGGTPAQMADVYREASPLTYVRPKLPPTLQLEGSRDCIVEARFTRAMHERLLEQGNRSLLLEIPWSDHAFDFVYFAAGNSIALPYVEAFLDATTR